MELTGTCVCPGKATGRIRFFRPGNKYTKKDIVVLDSWLTHEVMMCKGAGAVLCAKGAIMSHASIIARELGIPALICVDITLLKEGQPTEVDAAEEKVTLL